MKCITCTRLESGSHKELAKLGFGRCELEKEVGKFASYMYERQCENFDLAAEEVVSARIDWVAKRTSKS